MQTRAAVLINEYVVSGSASMSVLFIRSIEREREGKKCEGDEWLGNYQLVHFAATFS